MKIRIGIDVGAKTGAWGLICDGEYIDCGWIPTFKIGKQTFLHAREFMNDLDTSLMQNLATEKPNLVIIESQQAMPLQGVVSMFTLGSVYGALVACFQIKGWSIELCRPPIWKKEAGLLGSEKDASRGKAMMLFPECQLPLKKDHNKADALLIAYYGGKKEVREKEQKTNSIN